MDKKIPVLTDGVDDGIPTLTEAVEVSENGTLEPVYTKAVRGSELYNMREVVKTVDAYTVEDGLSYSDGKTIYQMMSEDLLSAFDAFEKGAYEEAVKRFSEIQKSRAYLMSEPEIKDPQNKDVRDFLEELIVQGHDGSAEAGLKATHGVYNVLRNNQILNEEGFDRLYQAARAMTASSPVLSYSDLEEGATPTEEDNESHLYL